jgi:hypothetical protein
MKTYKYLIISRLQVAIGLLGLFITTQTITTNLSPKQFDFKAIMPQQQLFAQKDVLQDLVKNVWENCLKTLAIKFSGLIEQNPTDEHIVSVSLNFEKQSKTDDNISFIKKTVQDVITTIPIRFVKFDQQKKDLQEQMLKSMLERMITNALIEVLLQDVSEPLDWCTCTAEYKRITLALLLVNETREKFPNKNQRIVYTSFASGFLLQDYVILSELLLSHTNILVNLIDLEYPNIPALAKKDLSKKKTRDLHMLEMKTKQESAHMIDSFKVKIAQIISERRSNYGDYNFEVNIYQNAYEYIARVQKNPTEKSNILILVDPSVWSFGMADFPSLANVINIFIDQEKTPVFTLYLPRHHGAQWYQATEVTDSEIMHNLHDQLRQLIVSTGASKNYTARLTNELLEKVISFDTQITDEILADSFPQLMQIRADLKKQALEEGDTSDNLLQPVTPVKLGDVPILLSWGTDAHISFQDLVWDTLAQKAIVYQLYAIDPIKSGDENNKIIKINPEVYKKMDVISPNAGAFSKQNNRYKRIS